MPNLGDRPCPDCGAARHHDVTGGCGPALPAAFYDDPQLTAALARLDFGPVFRRVDAYGQLRVLNTTLAPLHTSPGVTELRDRLTTTAT